MSEVGVLGAWLTGEGKLGFSGLSCIVQYSTQILILRNNVPRSWKYWPLMVNGSQFHSSLSIAFSHREVPHSRLSPSLGWLGPKSGSWGVMKAGPNGGQSWGCISLQSFPGVSKANTFQAAFSLHQIYLPHCCTVCLPRIPAISPLHKTPHLRLRQSKTGGQQPFSSANQCHAWECRGIVRSCLIEARNATMYLKDSTLSFYAGK